MEVWQLYNHFKKNNHFSLFIYSVCVQRKDKINELTFEVGIIDTTGAAWEHVTGENKFYLHHGFIYL